MRRRSRFRWLTFCGILSLLCLAGCWEWKTSWKLVTLANGDTIHVRQSIGASTVDFKVQKHEVIYHHHGGQEETVAVSARERWLPHVTPCGYDVLQDDTHLTVWRVFGRDVTPLAVVHLERTAKETGPSLQPAKGGDRTGRRIACRVSRDLIRARVSDGGTVYLSMDSSRNAGSGEGHANQDSLFLGYIRVTRNILTVINRVGDGSTFLSLNGSNCLVDPFASVPSLDVRWDGKRRAVWLVDHETNRVIGGLQLSGGPSPRSSVFRGDGVPPWADAAGAGPVPDWATSTAGTLIGSTAERERKAANKVHTRWDRVRSSTSSLHPLPTIETWP